MNNYELMLILKPDTTKANVASELDRINKKIKESSGELTNNQSWGLKSLSYELNGYTQGIYEIINFKLDSNSIVEFEKWLKLSEGSIIRYLITSV